MTSESRQESITVINKTYPEWGEKNGWLVCVGGINENGEWRRLYPVPYDLWRLAKYKKQAFKKWDIISVKTLKRPISKDPRRESYEPVDIANLQIVGHYGTTKKEWERRRAIVDANISPDLETLKERRYDDKRRGGWTSMGVIRPCDVDFVETERHRITEDEKHVLDVQMKTAPGSNNNIIRSHGLDTVTKKIGFRFKCVANSDCSGHYIMCTDWEMVELYRRFGFEKTRQKALWMAEHRDLYLMMGTVAHYDTFINVGLFYPPLLEVITK